MKVISLINSTMISETSATYALHYAKSFSLDLILVHIKERNSSQSTQKIFLNIQKVANSIGVEVDFIVCKNLKELKQLVLSKNIDIIFSSTKHKYSIFDNSFTKKIINMGMKVDLAIVKVVKLSGADSIDKIIMPIRGYQLSVKKFTFFSSLVNAYNSNAEIFSVDKITAREAATIDTKKVKRKLQKVVFNLRHYFRLANIMNMKFSIRHSYAFKEGDEIQSHIAKNSYDLAIVGGHHEKSLFKAHPIDVLFKSPMINTIYFIPSRDNL